MDAQPSTDTSTTLVQLAPPPPPALRPNRLPATAPSASTATAAHAFAEGRAALDEPLPSAMRASGIATHDCAAPESTPSEHMLQGKR